MHYRSWWLRSALMAALALGGAALADSPNKSAGTGKGGGDKAKCADGARTGVGDGQRDRGQANQDRDRRGGPDRRPGGNRDLRTEDVVERILSFDKNKDGKITKDELSERMQDLIAKGDTNKDGCLDKEEIRKLAPDLARDNRGGPDDRPRPPGPPPGFRPGGGVERAVGELKLTDDKKKAKAEEIAKEHGEKVRKFMDEAREEVLKKMKDVLSEEEFKTFKEALERPPGPPPGAPRPGDADRPGAPRPGGDIDRRIDQLQKELDELKRATRPNR